jgi:hypothetical protein
MQMLVFIFCKEFNVSPKDVIKYINAAKYSGVKGILELERRWFECLSHPIPKSLG